MLLWNNKTGKLEVCLTVVSKEGQSSLFASLSCAPAKTYTRMRCSLRLTVEVEPGAFKTSEMWIAHTSRRWLALIAAYLLLIAALVVCQVYCVLHCRRETVARHHQSPTIKAWDIAAAYAIHRGSDCQEKIGAAARL